MKRRNWSAEEKLIIILEGIKENRPIADICREHQISQGLFYNWRDKFLEGGKRALTNYLKDDNAYAAEIDNLQKIIGKQTIQIEILKKTAELFRTK
jgi:transposase-like protein